MENGEGAFARLNELAHLPTPVMTGEHDPIARQATAEPSHQRFLERSSSYFVVLRTGCGGGESEAGGLFRETAVRNPLLL